LIIFHRCFRLLLLLSDLFVAFTQLLAINYDRVGLCTALIARDKHFIIQQN